ncbi:hypothetical protein B2J86_14930 [Acidovorax sp. SRB_14]|uniref:Bug family tripartite tricarboxylate transporter substrate binding protein n=1 Tax=unclassified Acidovorax TaxID=2684926 RepID=UPI00145F569C|nr:MULTISPECIES: tripartite tricarboxylate transporter substrate binding protein [unclassified Acidovorax]NMM77399.1 hypothetical protein [Acidovorax sp. SRB_24]NMM82206.1 hypothetical protein [Acidovorax sp. SRB_14]NMM87755.1 hypothetical protein [Rhodococcus sp. SRB_17]
MMLKKFLTGVALGTVVLAASASSAPYTIVVPFTPGGASDSFARIVARELNQELGVPVIVENRPGAGGSVGAAAFSRLPKNTRSIFLGTISTHAINPYLYKNINYNAKTDFTPVAMVLSLQNMLAVNAKSNIQSVEDLAAEGKKRNLTFGSAGTGSSAHLSAETMAMMRPEMQVTHIPYKGANPANMDLLGGQIDFVFDNISSILPQVQSGKLRGLAVTSKERSHQATGIPTMDESGFKGYEVISWFGFWLPKGSDKAMVDDLNKALAKIYVKPEFVKSIKDVGASPTLKTGADFVAFVEGEQKRWKEMVEKLDIEM